MAEEFLVDGWYDTSVTVPCDCEDGPCDWVHYRRAE